MISFVKSHAQIHVTAYIIKIILSDIVMIIKTPDIL